MRFAILFSILSLSSAFQPHRVVRSPVRSRNLVSMTLSDIGAVSPTGYFDPLGLSEGRRDDELKRWRESEVKHGRICMLAAVGIPLQEKWHPLFEGKILGAAIYHFQQANVLLPYFWMLTLLFIGLAECQNILVGWETPKETKQRPFRENGGMATLKADYVPGDLGFDPLNFKQTFDFDDMRTKELQNGRLAMVAVAGMVAQELVTGKGILENLGR